MLVYLDISTYQGYGGWHYYAEFRTVYPDERRTMELQYTLDVHDAARFNKDEPGAYKAYRPGQKSKRFESLEKLYREAVRQWRDIFPDGDLLLVGEPSSAGPKPILDGDAGLSARLNPMAEECDAIGWYGHGQDERIEQLSISWWTALKEAGYTKHVPKF